MALCEICESDNGIDSLLPWKSYCLPFQAVIGTSHYPLHARGSLTLLYEGTWLCGRRRRAYLNTIHTHTHTHTQRGECGNASGNASKKLLDMRDVSR